MVVEKTLITRANETNRHDWKRFSVAILQAACLGGWKSRSMCRSMGSAVEKRWECMEKRGTLWARRRQLPGHSRSCHPSLLVWYLSCLWSACETALVNISVGLI